MAYEHEKSETTIFLDIVRNVLILVATGYAVSLIWQWNWIVALIATFPVYVVMLNLIGFATLPLYTLTPENRLQRIVARFNSSPPISLTQLQGTSMDERLSEMDKQLRDTPRVSLVIAVEMNKGKRNAHLFLGVVALAVILAFGWSNWLLLLPAALGVGSFLFQMNILIFSSELKRRSEEPEEEPAPSEAEELDEARRRIEFAEIMDGRPLGNLTYDEAESYTAEYCELLIEEGLIEKGLVSKESRLPTSLERMKEALKVECLRMCDQGGRFDDNCEAIVGCFMQLAYIVPDDLAEKASQRREAMDTLCSTEVSDTEAYNAAVDTLRVATSQPGTDVSHLRIQNMNELNVEWNAFVKKYRDKYIQLEDEGSLMRSSTVTSYHLPCGLWCEQRTET
ncbi:hypothetical protein LCGC14_2514050, partial [marine sediment metagenome]